MARIIESSLTGSTLTISVVDGGTLTIDASTLPYDIRDRAMYHGLRQKICDAAAMTKGATPADKFNAMQAVAQSLVDGDWSKRSGDGATPTVGIIYRAFEQWVMEQAAVKKAKTTPEAIKSLYSSKSKSEQLALRKIPRVAEIIETLRPTPSADIDTDALLGELF